MKKNLSKKKMFNVAMATALASGAAVAAAPANADAAVTFKDVPANNVHAKAIINLAERGIIKGFADGTFGPNKTVTRGQAAKIIAGILELDTKNVENPNFKDVKTTDEFYGAIAALKAEGIISGKPDGTYGQYDPLTRGQMAKIIVEGFDLLDEAETPFTDVPEKNTFAKYIKVLYGNKVTTGTTATTFSPNAFVTRGQLASFVVRAEAVETTVENDVTATISQVSATQVVTSEGTFEVDPSVAKVFNEANAAALKNANVELIVEYTNEKVAAVGEFFAAKTGKVVGVKGLTLNASETSFNAGGYLITNLVVNATKVAISEVKAETLQINKDGVTITGATIEKAINVAKNIIVVLNEVVAPKVNLEEGSKLTLDVKSIITELNLPANAKIQDIITNYTEIKDKLKDIIKDIITGGVTTPPVTPPAGGGGGTTTPPSTSATNYAHDASTDANTLVNALISGIETTYIDYGRINNKADAKPTNKNSVGTAITQGQAYVYDFADNHSTTLLSDIKNSVKRDTLKKNVLDKVGPIILDLDDKSIENIDSVYIDSVQLNTENITKNNYYGQLSSALTTDIVADTLSTMTGLTEATAKNLTVAGYFEGNYSKEGTVKITFDDKSELVYTITLQK